MNPESPQPNRNPLIAGVIAVAVILLIVGAISFAGNNKDEADSATTSSTSDTKQASEPKDTGAATDTGDTEATNTYSNGSYTGSGSYTSPGGTEEVEVTITLDGNKITDATVTTDPASPTSQQYQNEFKSGFKSLVVGKNIDDVKLSKVSGSSLTSQGFNAAIQQIKQEAKAA